jgi:hypothetical protein
MTVSESTNRIENLDLEDLALAHEVIAARGKTIAEFAAASDSFSLLQAHAAGQLLIQQLQDERSRLITELRNAQSIRDSLASNLSDDFCPKSLLGSSLLG